MSPIVPEDSPLRRPPLSLSRRQVLVLDGIRYASEMADLAYERIYAALQNIARSGSGPGPIPSRTIATVMLDAWSIIDAVHRFVKLVPCTRIGLAKRTADGEPWMRLLKDRTSDAIELRNAVQHQKDELANLLK